MQKTTSWASYRLVTLLSLTGIALVVTAITFSIALASSSGTMLPVADGSYTAWSLSTGTTHYTLVDESSCNGTTDYTFTSTVGNRDSYALSTSTIPNGATITQIDIKPCASRNASGGAAPKMNVFYRFNGANSADAGNYTLSGTTPVELATTTFSGLSLTKTSTSTLEVGAVLTSGTKGARLSRIATVVTYTVTVTPPNAPTSLGATASTTKPIIELAWTDASSDEDSFEVLRGTDGINFSHLATTSANAVSYSNSGLASTTTYYYQVRAYNSGGYSAVSNTASATTGQTPAAISDLGATASTSPLRIIVSWSDAADELSYKLERSTTSPSSGFSLRTTIAGNVTTFSDTSVASSSTYYYRIFALNGYGTSTASNVASTTTP